MNMKKKISAFDVVITILMIAFCVTIIFPFWDIVVRSLSSPETANSLKMMLWPKEFSTSSYEFIFRDDAIIRAFFVSVSRTVLGTLLSVLMVCICAYPLSHRNLPGRNVITTYFIITMFFSGGMIPNYINLRDLGLTNTFWVYILPGAVGVYNVLLTRNFIMSLDNGLEEAAMLDGAGYTRILFQIILPLMKPIILTVAMWIAVGHWNSWFDTQIYIRDSSLHTLAYVLQKMRDMTANESKELLDYMMLNPNAKITSTNVRMATTVVTMLPVMAIYPFIQKHFIKGIMVGSLKG